MRIFLRPDIGSLRKSDLDREALSRIDWVEAQPHDVPDGHCFVGDPDRVWPPPLPEPLRPSPVLSGERPWPPSWVKWESLREGVK